jgi:hypothetical protein
VIDPDGGFTVVSPRVAFGKVSRYCHAIVEAVDQLEVAFRIVLFRAVFLEPAIALPRGRRAITSKTSQRLPNRKTASRIAAPSTRCEPSSFGRSARTNWIVCSTINSVLQVKQAVVARFEVENLVPPAFEVSELVSRVAGVGTRRTLIHFSETAT